MYQNTAFFGGSFSPPTRMHVQVAIEIGKSLLQYTQTHTPGQKCAVFIVPVSEGYPKASVKRDCIDPVDRGLLVDSLREAVTEEIARNPFPNMELLEIEVGSWEIRSKDCVPTYDSVMEFKRFTTDQIFIAQGEDNIRSLFEGTWKKSVNLLNEFGFMVFPRGGTGAQVLERLATSLNPARNTTRGIDPGAILAKTIPVGAGFNDDTSSSGIRAAMQSIQGTTTPERMAMFYNGLYLTQPFLRELYTLPPAQFENVCVFGSLMTQSKEARIEYFAYLDGLENATLKAHLKALTVPRPFLANIFDIIVRNKEAFGILLRDIYPTVLETLCLIGAKNPSVFGPACEIKLIANSHKRKRKLRKQTKRR